MDDTSQGLMDRRLPVPLYHRLYVLIRDKIHSGEYPVGTLLPTEQELQAEFGVSRITAKRALDDLANEGLVERRRGRGTSVLFRPTLKPLGMPLDGLLDSLDSMANTTIVYALEATDDAPPRAVAERLRLRAGSIVFRLARVRAQADRNGRQTPFALLTSYTVDPEAAVLRSADLDRDSRLRCFREAGFVIGRAQQVLSACLADARAASALDVEVGSALLQLDRTLSDSRGRPFDHLNALYRPDRYQYRMELDVGAAAEA